MAQDISLDLTFCKVGFNSTSDSLQALFNSPLETASFGVACFILTHFRHDEIMDVITKIRNQKKVRDISNIQTSFEELLRIYQKAKNVLQTGENAPRFYIRCLVELEEFVNEVRFHHHSSGALLLIARRRCGRCFYSSCQRGKDAYYLVAIRLIQLLVT